MSDTSQGEGWWIASDGKWYAPEQHPDYVAPVAPPDYAADTMAVPSPGQPIVPSQPVGPAFEPAGPATQTFDASTSSQTQSVQTLNDPNYNLPDTDAGSGSKRGLILGIGAVVLVIGLAFLAFRFFGGGSGAGGADSAEGAVDQLIVSINDRDLVGFVDVFDPDEIDAWIGSFAPAVAEFETLTGESADMRDDLTDTYKSVFDSFGYSLTGAGGEPVTYEVEPLDPEGRISRVRVQGLDFTISTSGAETALIIGDGNDGPTGVDFTDIDGTTVEFRDERGGLASRLLRPGQPTEDEFAPDAHIDLVAVEKDGKWFISIGYSMLEIARTQGAFDRYPDPEFGRAFDLVQNQTGGADTPEDAVLDYFSAAETLDYTSMIELSDPFATPYLHDYQILIDSEVSDADRREAARDINLRFDDLELGRSEWEGRTLVTTADVSGRIGDGGSFSLDTATWCVTIEDDFNRERGCLEDIIAEGLFEIGSDADPRDFIPEETGFIVIERNGRWYIDALGTYGFYVDQLAEAVVLLADDLLEDAEDDPFSDFGSFQNEFDSLFIFEGPIARQGQPQTVQADAAEHAGIALDLSGFDTLNSDGTEFEIAVVRVVTDQPGTFASYEETPLTGEDWVVAYRATDTEFEIPAVGVNTTGQLDVELFEAPVIEVGPEGFSGQLGGQGRPQVFVFTPEALANDIIVEGVDIDRVNRWETTGIVTRPSFRDSSGVISGGAFAVATGEPGAPYTITVQSFDEPAPPPAQVDPPDDGSGALVDFFAGFVEPNGYVLIDTQQGGFFDGCGGPNDPDVTSNLFENADGELVVLTPYPSVTRAEDAFRDLASVATPCDRFPNVVVNEVVILSDSEIRIEWELLDDPNSLTYEHYRLSGDTIVVANGSLGTIAEQLAFLSTW